MNVKDTLRQIAALEAELGAYFDGLISEAIRDMTDQYWTLSGERPAEMDEDNFTRADDVGWSDSNPVEEFPDPDDREHIYREEVRSVVRKGEFTLVCIRTCTGDGCEDLIFDNSKEIKTLSGESNEQ